MLVLDHFAVAAETLVEGKTYVEEVLGVGLDQGGEHPMFGTHNMLLSLGDVYLEVIAIDPNAPKPAQARWFNLDNFSGRPRVTNWVCRSDKLKRDLGKLLPGTGQMIEVSRGEMVWDITVPKDGKLPLGGQAPAIIDWRGASTPAERLPDRGCRLKKMTLRAPGAITLRSSIGAILSDPRITIKGAEEPSYEIEIETPSGIKTLR
jgi:hypothetical protein